MDNTANAALPNRARPRLAYLASREASYSRVAIVRGALEANFEIVAFQSDRKRYPTRIALLLGRFCMAVWSGRLKEVDALIIGFFAQPVLPIIRLLWRGPLISDGYLSLYDTLVHDKAKASPKSIRGRLAFWLDRFMLKHSDLVFTDTNADASFFAESFGVPGARVKRLWVSAEANVFRKLPTRPLNRDEPMEVLFWGGFIPLQGVDVILRAAQRLVSKSAQVHFTIVGTGQTYRECRALARSLAVSNVSFLGWQTLEGLVECAARAHLILGIFGTTAKAGRVIPNKVFQAMALAKPLITGDGEAARELLCDGENALLVPRGDPESLARRIDWARENYAEVLGVGQRGYATFFEEASPTCVAEILAKEVGECLTRTSTTRRSKPSARST